MLILFTKEERIYLIQCYGTGNASYKYAIELFCEKFSNTFNSKEHCENQKFTDLEIVSAYTEPGDEMKRLYFLLLLGRNYIKRQTISQIYIFYR